MFCFFFFNDTATTEIYTLSLHDALPISIGSQTMQVFTPGEVTGKSEDTGKKRAANKYLAVRSEEHTSELQSRQYLVCRLLLEKKKNKQIPQPLSIPYTIHYNYDDTQARH